MIITREEHKAMKDKIDDSLQRVSFWEKDRNRFRDMWLVEKTRADKNEEARALFDTCWLRLQRMTVLAYALLITQSVLTSLCILALRHV